MGKIRTGWDWLNHAFTIQALCKLILPLVGVGAIAAYLAWLTTFLRMFAPVSYLLVALLAIMLASFALAGVVNLARQMGWSPKVHERRHPTRNAALSQVLQYLANESAYGINNVTGKTKLREIALELMDRIIENRLTVWGRVGDFHIAPIEEHVLKTSAFELSSDAMKRVTEWGTIDYKNVQLNWREVRKTWPRPPLWRRMSAQWKKNRQSSALTAS